MDQPIAGKRILVVEDEVLVAAMLKDILEDLGAVVVGPALTLSTALAMAETEQIWGAILDVNLRGVRIDPVTGILTRRNIPFALATGYSGPILAAWPDVPVIAKPYSAQEVESVLVRMNGAG